MKESYAEAFAIMKVNKITWGDIAEKLGWTRAYTSMVINGKENPKQGEEKIRNAVSEIIAERKGYAGK